MLHCSVHLFAVTDIELHSSHSVTVHIVQILGATLSFILEGKKAGLNLAKELYRRSNTHQPPNQAKENMQSRQHYQDSPAVQRGRR